MEENQLSYSFILCWNTFSRYVEDYFIKNVIVANWPIQIFLTPILGTVSIIFVHDISNVPYIWRSFKVYNNYNFDYTICFIN